MKGKELGIRALRNSETANAFIFGVIFNQNQKAEQAWKAPYVLKERLGTLNPRRIMTSTFGKVLAAVSQRPALHPFAMAMTEYVMAACKLLNSKYDDDARNIWKGHIKSSALIYRLREFDGIGRHKAQVALFLLQHEFSVSFEHDIKQADLLTSCPRLYEIYGA